MKYSEYLKNKEDYILIDIRDLESIQTRGTIENSINIYKQELLKNYKNLITKDKKYIIFCNGGNSAKTISAVLTNDGYYVVALEQGYTGYLNYLETQK